MSVQNLSRPESADITAAALLESLRPGLSSASLGRATRPVESLDSVLFAFNPWLPFVNFSLKGFGGGIQIPVLNRLELIPLRVWKQPDIQVRPGGFTVGSINTSGAFPSGSVGSKVTQRFQFPSESAKNLLAMYGSESTSNIGMIVFRFLGGETDKEKLESILLFRAVMETPFDGQRRGCDLLLEELPKFLIEKAPGLLKDACRIGVALSDKEFAGLSPNAHELGETMIEDIQSSIAAATARATAETTGILSVSKREIIQASRGQKDVKLIADDLDNWLLEQFPSFRMDNDIERSMRATQGIADAINKSGQNQEMTMTQLIELNRLTLEQLANANALNQKLREDAVASTAAPSTAPVPDAL